MMKFVLLMIIVGAAVATLSPNPEYDTLWTFFKKKFQKKYQPSEEQPRRLIWESNVKIISKHNLEADVGIHTYKAGLNEYADLTHEEFVKQMNGFKKSNASSTASLFVPPTGTELPAAVDWRRKGFVTPVKDQQLCGSCWAFSATGSLEGQHMNKTGKLVSLSEQNLIDCSRPEGNDGCEGGYMTAAFNYVVKNKGIDTEASYPYIHKDSTCKFMKENVGATCIGYKTIPFGDEKALQVAVAVVGPISVAIDASSLSFGLYSSGIYDNPDCSTTSLDHGVLVVGYGTEDGVDYWLVKNSWGASWGEKGYIKMSRNKNNQCGIATEASYPLV